MQESFCREFFREVISHAVLCTKWEEYSFDECERSLSSVVYCQCGKQFTLSYLKKNLLKPEMAEGLKEAITQLRRGDIVYNAIRGEMVALERGNPIFSLEI